MSLRKSLPNRVSRSVRYLLTALVICSATMKAQAASPTLQHLYPAGISAGASRSIRSTGKIDPWPPQVWISGTGVRLEPEEKEKVWRVIADKNAPIGPRLVRFFNDEGASSPRYIIVSQTSDGEESEPNDRIDEANSIQDLPALTHGRLNRRQDTDMFRIHLQAGQTFIARLDAYVLGSTTDAILRLLNEDNRVLDWNHDHYYLDPCIFYEVSSTGYYWIQVMGFPYPATSSEELGGGDGYIYRLFMSDSAYIREENVSTEGELTLTGWNLATPGGLKKRGHSFQSSMELATDFQSTLIFANRVNPEIEPNNSKENATPLSSSARGIIQSNEDVDWFSFDVGNEAWHQFEIQSARLGYPSDLLLKLYGANGKEIKSDDDAATMNDPRIIWKSPESGRYFLKVTSLTHQGGDNQVYRLIHSIKQPTCELTTSASEFALKPGESLEIKVGIERRHGHTRTLIIQPANLPAGISCAPVIADKKRKEITLKLHATPSSSQFQGLLSIIGKEKDDWNKTFLAGKATVATKVNNGVPSGYLDQVYRKIHHLWLTIQPKTQAKEPEEN